MKLTKILQNIQVEKTIGEIRDCDILDVVCDTKLVTFGSLFICIKGDCFDGHTLVSQAELYGARAIVCEREVECGIPQIIVSDTRLAMSYIAQNFYRMPAKKLKLIGVTGTNGKTTTTQMIYEILKYAGVKYGVIGTLGAKYLDKQIDCKLTTPDPLELNKILREMVDNGVEVVAMEVSAHAIYYDKIKGLDFEVGIFTNITLDHLDFFGTMENYLDAKMKFFNETSIKYSLINVDDEKISLEKINQKNLITFGLENPADVFAVNFKHHQNYTSFVVNLFDCVYSVKLKLKGLFNVYNALAALTACSLCGVKPYIACRGIEQIENIPGRLEKVYSKDFDIYIDYAHTPDGIEKTLFTLKNICKNKLICVFGCGGNRDASKRKIMGEISGKLSDYTILTTDNPRYEEPMEIISQIEEGVFLKTKKYIIIQDREEAINYAIQIAEKNDIILVAGKGREKFQEVLGIKKPFEDYATIKELLQRNGL